MSMTGYGSGTANANGISATVEIRSVNNRFCEVSSRLPKSLQMREQEIKELVRTRANRGKINLTVSVEKATNQAPPIKVDIGLAKTYTKLLNDLRNEVGLTSEVSLETLLTFSDILTVPDETIEDGIEWAVVQQALEEALAQLHAMRKNEGTVISHDLRMRIDLITQHLIHIEQLSAQRVPQERERLRTRVAELVGNVKIDPMRLELEIALLADKLDITEECVRFRSHVDYCLHILEETESSGRKLNFLLQEMNREANTIGSKCNDAEIAHHVVAIKDELERIREQIQNIE